MKNLLQNQKKSLIWMKSKKKSLFLKMRKKT